LRTVEIEYLKARLARALLGKKGKPRRRKAKRASTRSVVDASRTAMAVLASDCTSFAEAVVRHTERGISVVRKKTSVRNVWLPSFIALGSADVAIASVTAARSSLGLEALGALGGLGLIGVASMNLWRARTSEEALDAAADLAWGAQGFSYVTGAARLATFTGGMGFVGATARMTVGVVRIRRGIQRGDKQSVKLGALDLCAGVLWGALDVAGLSHPVVLGGYVAAMVGREAYANRAALRELLFSDVPRLVRPPVRKLAEIWAMP
jgi:hypothetical protein